MAADRSPANNDTTSPATGEDPEPLVAEVNRLIDARQVRTVFQPVVHLATAEVVGYEALARGPVGGPLESPVRLLEAGRRAGRLAELDWICAATACEAALAADLHPSMTVFLNFEPETLLAPCPEDLRGPARRALDHLRVVIETEEETLGDVPSQLLEALGLVHDVGWGVAIDNAEASPATLALLPLVHPDVLKLDLLRLRGALTGVVAMTDGARSYAERTGATILAQNMEHHEDLMLAMLAGATYGQGHLFGPPAPLSSARVVPRSVVPLLPKVAPSTLETPFEIVAGSRPSAVTEHRFLAPLSRYLEEQVDAHGPPALLLVNFRDSTGESTSSRRRLADLARRAAFTLAFGAAPASDARPSPRLRTARLGPGDPMADEWIVLVLGPHYAAGLVARDLADPGDPGDLAHRRLEYALTHDRELVLQATLSFVGRAAASAPLLG